MIRARRAETDIPVTNTYRASRGMQASRATEGRMSSSLSRPRISMGGQTHMHAADSKHMHAAALHEADHGLRPGGRLVAQHGRNHYLPGLIVRRRTLFQQPCRLFPEIQGSRQKPAAPVSRPQLGKSFQPDSGHYPVQITPPFPVKQAGSARRFQGINLPFKPVAFSRFQRKLFFKGRNRIKPLGPVRPEQDGTPGNGINGTFRRKSAALFHSQTPVLPPVIQQTAAGPDRQRDGQQTHGRHPEQTGQQNPAGAERP